MGNLEQRLKRCLRCFVPFALLALFAVTACNFSDSSYAPKPRGYFRIEFPAKDYLPFDQGFPYTFNYPTYGKIEPDKNDPKNPYWINLHFPRFNGTLHLSYYKISSKKQFNELIEDSRTLAFKHTVKATGIDEAFISYPDKKVYGIYYTITGNTASSAQFYLTDSSSNYLRAALYFDEVPRIDSLAPVIDFLKEDLNVFIKSFRWKEK